ncbi:MAG: response regulator [Bacilli bacterium]|nr:response regulator [Bacilli bacterium]
MSGVWLPFGSLVLAIYLVVLFFIKGSVKNYETTIYRKLIIINLLYSTFGVVIYLFAMKVGHLYFTGVLQSFYLIMMDLMLLFLLEYVIELNTFSKKSKKVMNIVFSVITTIIVLFILILPMDTIISGETVDLNGPAYYAAMVEIVLYMFLIIFFCVLLYTRNKNEKSKLLPFIILFVFFIIGLILRNYYPEVITETFIFTLSYLVMYHTIENPDLKMLKQMELAKDQAERANNAKSDFLSSMSHEIRTPLNAIVGFSEDLQSYKDTADPEIIEDANYIMEASKTLLEIVGNILDINKIESNKMEITEVKYNFKEEIENLAKIDATRIGEKNINFKINLAPDIPYELLGDKTHMKEIVNNLLTNAIKYTEQGEIELSVKCINQNNISNLIISVRDTGRGIKAENIEKLFTKFERLDVEKNSTTEGTGLGLAITKALVEMMGGKINVQSTFGQGSLFVVQIPQKISMLADPNQTIEINITPKQTAVPVVQEIVEPKVEVETPNIVLPTGFNSKKLLIVDDNKLNIKVARRALQDFDLEIDECYDGEECLKKVVNGDEYDLILMDIMMPNMSGETAIAKLRENPNFKIPTIALTADAVAGAQEKYISEGFVDYIAKPFSKEQIKEKLDKIFK